MTKELEKLASQIAEREGKKHESTIGDIREILGLITTIDAEERQKRATSPTVMLMKEGAKKYRELVLVERQKTLDRTKQVQKEHAAKKKPKKSDSK